MTRPFQRRSPGGLKSWEIGEGRPLLISAGSSSMPIPISRRNGNGRRQNLPGVPVWSHDGIVCTGESYKQAVKLTFARGASVEDPKKLFNSSLEGNTRRAIDFREGEKINEAAFKQLIRAAVAANSVALAQRAAKKK